MAALYRSSAANARACKQIEAALQNKKKITTSGADALPAVLAALDAVDGVVRSMADADLLEHALLLVFGGAVADRFVARASDWTKSGEAGRSPPSSTDPAGVDTTSGRVTPRPCSVRRRGVGGARR